MSFEKLVGLKVIAAGAFSLGEVKGAEVDFATWQITHLQIKLDDVAAEKLGLKKRFRSSIVCMPVSMIDAIGDYITISKSIDELSQSSEITECKE
ncbi:MAG: hypothetical protein NWF00_08910 [Candidatus Bathyarchaeota archaeon]|nr:hypothetical protein [Candidatus Bathyarchaeota archaeon]